MAHLFRGVMVSDSHRTEGTLLRAAEDAGVPPGVWKGRGLAVVGLTAGAVVSERQAELLLDQVRHPDADRIERELLAAGESPARARRSSRPTPSTPSCSWRRYLPGSGGRESRAR
ncbi:hypothetical protein [Streptomyces sp. NPDC047725]|uniref:hypothetical protein n=1 Tax=Streptomyces sp. NPDC047725 TaxID=3365487 RepID=UPI0037167111